MQFQTQIPFTPEANQIDYDSEVLLLGSCFAANIGAKLDYFQFKNLQNPFGILFHPLSIYRLIERAIKQRPFTETDVFETEGHWHCFEAHSLLFGQSKSEYLSLLNQRLQDLESYIKNASHIILTYGTAWVYRHLERDLVVANCHKVPQKKFSKELLSVEEVTTTTRGICDLITSVNPKAQCIATVSPVRHLKDGFVQNARSKAHLLAGLHAVDGLQYFPAFELLMDELREYRFYEKDMIHPNETAIGVVWDRFTYVWIASETENLQKEVAAIQQGLSHRPFYPESASNEAFQKNLQDKIAKLKHRLPHSNFS